MVAHQTIAWQKLACLVCQVRDLVFWQWTLDKQALMNIMSVARTRKDFKAASEEQSFLPYLAEFGRRRVTDERDRVFALLSLFPDVQSTGLKADYTSTSADVSSKAAIFCMNNGFHLDVLSYAVAAVEEKTQAPRLIESVGTWVPSWGYGKHTPFATFPFSASKDYPQHYHVCAEAFRVDTVRTVGGTLAEDITLNIDSVPTILHAWEAIAMELTNQSHRCSKDGFEDSWFSQWDTADQDVTRLKELDYALPNLTQVVIKIPEVVRHVKSGGCSVNDDTEQPPQDLLRGSSTSSRISRLV
ncbi:MAG: hypothetical protein MMC23_001103 [Stictis urceolatum]|nr:hypothetical protein [Stictis urceolata]